RRDAGPPALVDRDAAWGGGAGRRRHGSRVTSAGGAAARGVDFVAVSLTTPTHVVDLGSQRASRCLGRGGLVDRSSSRPTSNFGDLAPGAGGGGGAAPGTGGGGGAGRAGSG